MRVIIAGGGTAGHVNPGIAIAKCIKKKYPDAGILFIGTEKGLEKELVALEGFDICFIKARGLERKVSLKNFASIKDTVSGYFQAKKIIKEFKPDFVIGTGGYVCFPVIMSAWKMKIPSMIHESNSLPGIANKMLASFTNVVAVSFKDTEKYFKACKAVVYTGNPVRKEIVEISKEKAREEQGIDKEESLVLVFGGSRGAQKINNAIIELIKINKGVMPYRIVLSTGKSQYENVLRAFSEEGLDVETIKNLKVVPFVYDMPKLLASADLVISRAGAVTVSEISAVGIASILIPYPFATENHQEFNARSLEKNGASIVVLDKDVTGEIINAQIVSLLENKEQLSRMARNAKKMGIIDADEKILRIIEDRIEK